VPVRLNVKDGSGSLLFPSSSKTISALRNSDVSSKDESLVADDRYPPVDYKIALSKYEESKAKGETPSADVFKDLLESFYKKTLMSSSPEYQGDVSVQRQLEVDDIAERRHSALFRLYLIFQEMKINGVEPDAAVYNTLINACAGAGDLEKALETVSAMQTEGISPNVITYTSLIKACGINGGAGAVQLAEEVFSAMQQRTNHFSSYVEPTMLTFQRLIQVSLHHSYTT
jgi:pentatricopeptide repeat protein